MENYESEQFEWPGETGAVFNEAEEMEFASQLMEVNDEQELDQFLGALIRKAGRALGGFVNSPPARRSAAFSKARSDKFCRMPPARSARSSAGRSGAQIGSGLASIAGNELGMEAETWNQEDSEYEGARQFVRVAADTVRNTLAAGPLRRADGGRASRDRPGGAMLAPGLLQAVPPRMGVAAASGRWMRRGNNIVLYGV